MTANRASHVWDTVFWLRARHLDVALGFEVRSHLVRNVGGGGAGPPQVQLRVGDVDEGLIGGQDVIADQAPKGDAPNQGGVGADPLVVDINSIGTAK
jgi:hypothetical protein